VVSGDGNPICGPIVEEIDMKISECMTRNVRLADPGETIHAAAKAMADLDTGALPVGDNDRLVGMITDRDIAVRAVATGKGPETKVRDVMTADIRYCFEDEDSEHVLHNMGEQQVRRLPVLNRGKRLVGIVALGDLAREGQHGTVGQVVGRVSEPGGQHSQTAG
jgi:CBS domain-containing protein